MTLDNRNSPLPVLSASRLRSILQVASGRSCQNMHLMTGRFLPNTSISLGERPNFLTRHCQFPQYWGNPRSHPHPLTLQTSTASPATFLWIHLALDRQAVWFMSFSQPGCSYLHSLPLKTVLTAKAQLNSSFHPQPISISSRAWASFPTWLDYSILPGTSHSMGKEVRKSV